jgi:hypothetical protein
MSVEDALTRICTGIEDGAIASQATFAGDLIGSGKERCSYGR